MLKRRMRKRIATAPEGIVLSHEKSTASTDLFDHAILLFGERKIGKTTMMAEVDRAFFFPCEHGTKSVSVHQPMDKNGKPIGITSWEMMVDYAGSFLEDDYFQCGVIDTVDAMGKLAKEYVCRKLAIEHPSDMEWGKGWDRLAEETRGVIDALIGSSRGVVMLSHAKVAEVEKWDGREFEQVCCTLTGQLGDYVTGLVGIWVYYGYLKHERRLWLRGNEQLDVGLRPKDHFLTPDGVPLHSISMGSSPREAYTNFVAAFNNEYVEPAQERRKKLLKKRK